MAHLRPAQTLSAMENSFGNNRIYNQETLTWLSPPNPETDLTICSIVRAERLILLCCAAALRADRSW
jgi:hypothetical protein